jgi:hypothetical protein
MVAVEADKHEIRVSIPTAGMTPEAVSAFVIDRKLDFQGDRLIGNWIFRGIGSGRGLSAKPNILFLFADDQRADTIAARRAKPEPPVAKRTRRKTPRNPHRETPLSRAHANAVPPAPIDEMI